MAAALILRCKNQLSIIMDLQEILKMQGTTLVDVRTVEEYEEGTIEGAVNIPLHTIPVRIEEIKA